MKQIFIFHKDANLMETGVHSFIKMHYSVAICEYLQLISFNSKNGNDIQ